MHFILLFVKKMKTSEWINLEMGHEQKKKKLNSPKNRQIGSVNPPHDTTTPFVNHPPAAAGRSLTWVPWPSGRRRKGRDG
jgi:hypothetical protein